MADLDYYASYADVQHILMNADLGTTGNNLMDDDMIEKVLKISQAKLHLQLGIDNLTSITHVVYKELLKEMQVDQVMQRILAARHANENNLSSLDVVQAFWQISPTITYSQQSDLRMMKRRLSTTKGMYNHDIRTGQRI